MVWVDMAHIVSTAARQALSVTTVQEVVENWEALGVLVLNEHRTKVTLMVKLGEKMPEDEIRKMIEEDEAEHD